LPEVDVFNCKVAPIDPESPWPPPGSTYEPVSTYGELYKTGEWAPLHSTYMLLWNYQGYNPDVSPAVFQSGGYAKFIGPKKGSSPVKLVVQDALMFKTDTFVLFPGAIRLTERRDWRTEIDNIGKKKNKPAPNWAGLFLYNQ
jgi:hypothetical protein